MICFLLFSEETERVKDMSFIASLFGGRPKSVDYAAIERKRLADASAAENKAKEEAYASELEKLKTLRGRGSLMLSTSSGKDTFG